MPVEPLQPAAIVPEENAVAMAVNLGSAPDGLAKTTRPASTVLASKLRSSKAIAPFRSIESTVEEFGSRTPLRG